MAKIERIHPTARELTTINNCLKCEVCGETFKSESNLNLHLYKTHNRREIFDKCKNDGAVRQFHCPETECPYNVGKHFKNKKLLKQHYLKVHSAKDHICDSCKRGFSSQTYKNLHSEYCGVQFRCSECPLVYPCYESLMTHGRRKGHSIDEKICFKLAKHTAKKTVRKATIETAGIVRIPEAQRPILAKPLPISIPVILVPIKLGDGKNEQRSAPDAKRLRSKCDVQTQIDSKLDKNSDRGKFVGQIEVENRTDSETDTNLIDHFDTSFFSNCNMETQTDPIFNDDFFDCCEFYSNMCTQTCDNPLIGSIDLTKKIDGNDEMLKSVKSQTMMSRKSNSNSYYCRDINHMETQTDAEFRQMFEL